MVEEFQEADVLWPEDSTATMVSELTEDSPSNCARPKESAPINIPNKARSTGKSWTASFTYQDIENDEDGGDGNGGGSRKLIPPHILASQRVNEKMAYSVCTGHGRTLKGRDLRRVRNSVLRLTGFIER